MTLGPAAQASVEGDVPTRVSWDSWAPEDSFDDIPFQPDPRDHSSLGHGFGLGLWEVLTAVF